MLDQSNQAAQSALAPQELRQYLLDSLHEAQQAVEELSDNELEMITGGVTPNLSRASSSSSIHSADFHDVPDKLPSTLDKLKNHYKEFKPFYQKVAGSAAIGFVGGTLAAIGLQK